jgi:hypothetical protein
MTVIQPFIYYRENDRYFILYKYFPYYYAEIVTSPDPSVLFEVPVGGYRLYLRLIGTIDGKGVLLRDGWKGEITDIGNKMVRWFVENVINKDEKRYRKFLL